MDTEPAPPSVTHNPAASRFELAIGEAMARLEYSTDEGVMTIRHTFVPEELRGRNIAGQLAAGAFDHARSEGLKVLPQCSYIAVYVERQPEAAALLVSAHE
jgi:predicted GNAT family acetyltransferase